jgi:hypothetical protein
MNDWSYQVLERIFSLVSRLGFPLIVCAWIVTAAAVIVMARVLKRSLRAAVTIPSLIVGGISLAAHLLDYLGTLKITPDLAVEANPIWRIVVERLGLAVARWYGLTGKIMLAVLSFEFFAYYLVSRSRLLPAAARGFSDFWKKYGQSAHPGTRLANFFAFLFALIGPFCFYIAFLNAISDSRYYDRLPAMPVALGAYIFVLAVIYLLGNYLSWRASRLNNP